MQGKTDCLLYATNNTAISVTEIYTSVMEAAVENGRLQ